MADIYDLPRARANRRIDELTQTFGIGEYLTTPVRKLSLGERVRCEIAASLIHEPEILFLDEPTIGLDVVVKQRIRQLILTANRKQGVTVFLTSYDTGDIEKLGRRAIVINRGRVMWDGTMKDLKYSFLTHRVIDLKLEDPLRFESPGVRVLKSHDRSAKLHVDTQVTSVEQAVQQIVRRNRIVDISISSPPMDEVISSIYAGGPP